MKNDYGSEKKMLVTASGSDCWPGLPFLVPAQTEAGPTSVLLQAHGNKGRMLQLMCTQTRRKWLHKG